MGNLTSSLHSLFWRPEPCRLLLLGIDAAGKTTILYKLKPPTAEIETTIPTIGLNVEKLYFRGTIIASFDVGGREGDGRFKFLLAKRGKTTKDMDGIIFVVDSNDTHRLPQTRDELHYILDDEELKHKPLLIFCNKQDLPNALAPSEIVTILELPKSTKWHAIGCTATKGTGLSEGFEWMNRAIEQEKHGNVGSKYDDLTTNISVHSSDDSEIDIDYDPTEDGGNLTLQRFSPIKNGTECPFAKSACLWGGSPNVGGTTLEEQAKANVAALTEFVRQSNEGEGLDGFCIELDDPKATQGGPKELGECVRRMLTALSDEDPAGEYLMRKDYIGSRGWRFRFKRADFFITTFAPCYPSTSSRYAFDTGRAFLLFQPELSFARHKLPRDTPRTNWDAPATVRDKTRVAFRDAGRSYFIPSTTRYPPAEHIVRPLHDDGESVVRWWEPASNNDE